MGRVFRNPESMNKQPFFYLGRVSLKNKTSKPKGNDRSPESQKVVIFLTSSRVRKQLRKNGNTISPIMSVMAI